LIMMFAVVVLELECFYWGPFPDMYSNRESIRVAKSPSNDPIKKFILIGYESV
jgi:hypothetical protein